MMTTRSFMKSLQDQREQTPLGFLSLRVKYLPRCHVAIKTKDTQFENKFLMNIDVGLGQLQ